MEKNIAVLFEKITINENFFIFVPISCIEGEDRKSVFLTEFNNYFQNMSDPYSLYTSDKYLYGYVTDSNELKNKFNVDSKKEALGCYFECFAEKIFFGYIDSDYKVNLIDIDLAKYIKLDKIKSKEKEKIVKKTLPHFEIASNNKVMNDKKINIKELIECVNKNVIDQNEAVDTIATTIAINHMNDNPKNHSNILVTGPTGVGKTEILNSIAKEINIPCVIADMSSITQEGYVGKSVDSLLSKVYNVANGDLDLAQRSILALDEIDKKASKSNNDVAGRAVLNSLLKILDGNIIDVNIGTSQSPKYIKFDTSHLTIVSLGAFAGLNKNEAPKIGFGNIEKFELKNNKESYFEFGMPEEFMGRMDVIVTLKELTFDNYINILYKSCNSPLFLKKQLLKDLGVVLKMNSSYIREIARKTLSLKAGARGLKIAVNESLQPALTEIVKNGTYKELSVDGETVYNPKKYILK